MRTTFRLRVRARGEDAIIKVERSRAGRPVQRYRQPFSDREQDELLDWFEEESLTPEAQAEVYQRSVWTGQALFDGLLPASARQRGDIRGAFRDTLQQAGSDGPPPDGAGAL